MAVDRRTVTFVAAALTGAFAVWELSSVAMPFMFGLLVAYVVRPICLRLERPGLSPGAAAAVLIGGMFIAAITAAMLVLPFLAQQLAGFLALLPDLQREAVARLQPYWSMLRPYLDSQTLSNIQDAASSSMGTVARTSEAVLRGALASGSAVVDMVTFAILVPLTAYYALRDWTHLVAVLDRHVPARVAPFVRGQAREINRTLSSWLRGQALSCLILASFYGVGLTWCGLRYGLLIGMFTGLCAFVPFVGYCLGLAAACVAALFTFGDWTGWAGMGAVFLCGNILEGYILTPRLVGRSVGLHEVSVMFALMAFGHMFGFIGIMLAVPMAAVVGVLARTASDRYVHSRWFAEWPGFWDGPAPCAVAEIRGAGDTTPRPPVRVEDLP